MAIELAAERRTLSDKQAVKQLRLQGRLPGNIYGGKLGESQAISLDLKEAEKVIRANGMKADYSVKLDGESYNARLQEVQLEPLRKGFIHVDFAVTAINNG